MSMYDKNEVEWMWRELANVGVKPLTSSEDVESELTNTDGTIMVMVNSVCGCAAGAARPGVALALQNNLIPDRLTTVFAGVNTEATAKAREYFSDVPPSSPSMALIKDGKLVFFLPRHEIEGYSYDEIAKKIIPAFNEHCTKEGPSVSLEEVKAAFDRKQ